MSDSSDVTYQIREMRHTDLAQLLAMEEATQVAPWTEAVFLRCQEAKYPGWVIEVDDQLIGFILISVSAGECHVLNLCVHPIFQGKKFGRKLMVTAMVWVKQRGVEIVYLEVRRSNLRAIWLYRKMNFKQIGERKNYYPLANGSEDALVFARDLGVDDLEDIMAES